MSQICLNLVGQSIGPAVASLFQETYQETINGVDGSYPSIGAYELIFFTATLISLTAIILSLSLHRRKIVI